MFRVFKYGAIILAAATLIASPMTAFGSRTTNANLVPSRGAFLGVFPNEGPSGTCPCYSHFESVVGHRIEIIHQYYAWNEQSVKTQATLLASGHIPLVSWTAAPTTTASAIAAGKQDTQIRHMALALKALPGKVFLRPFFEFDQPPGMPRYIGTPSQVIAAWRRTYTMFHNLGATNVRFVWCPMAYNFGPSRRIDARLFWPGSGYVDWIGGDSYNYPNRHWYSFGELFGPEYAWAVLQQKPMMVAETGSPVNDSRTPAWIAGASSWVKAHPDLRALVFFDATGRDGTPYELLTHQAVLKAFRAVAGDAFFNP